MGFHQKGSCDAQRVQLTTTSVHATCHQPSTIELNSLHDLTCNVVPKDIGAKLPSKTITITPKTLIEINRGSMIAAMQCNFQHAR
eukprot:6203131-Amphidinium_carterae.1